MLALTCSHGRHSEVPANDLAPEPDLMVKEGKGEGQQSKQCCHEVTIAEWKTQVSGGLEEPNLEERREGGRKQAMR